MKGPTVGNALISTIAFPAVSSRDWESVVDRLWQPVAKVARSLLASLGRLLRCRNSLVFQSILLHFDASNPAQIRGAPTRGTFATGCQCSTAPLRICLDAGLSGPWTPN